jgi:hypothetical protein
MLNTGRKTVRVLEKSKKAPEHRDSSQPMA